MRNLIRQRPGAVVFALALAVRLFYFALYDQPPVQFDARQYVAVAVAAPLAVTNPSLLNDSIARESISFTRVLNDVVADEQVSWFPYQVPSFGLAFDWLFFSGPTYPAFLAAIFHTTPFQDFWVARIVQAILDSLTALLIWLIMRRLISNLGGWVAALSWIVYGPAIIRTGELVTETISIFLTVLMLWLFLRAIDTQRDRWIILAGVACSLLAMAKASTVLLIVPMLMAWCWANRSRGRRLMRSAALLVGSWLIVATPWLFLVEHRLGQITFRDPSYGGGNFRQANILETEGYNTDRAPSDFWTYPVWREMRKHPAEYARLYLQKFRRLWWRASDDYRIGYPFGETGLQWHHRLLVLFAAVGVLVWTRRAGPAAWLAIATIIYFAGLHTVMHVVSRYNMLAMPAVIGAAVCGAFWLGDETRPGFLKRFAIILGIIAAAVALIKILVPSFWLLIPGITLSVAIWLYWVIAVAVIATAIFLCFSLRQSREGGQSLAMAVSVAIALIFLGWATTREAYAEWAAYLSEPGEKVQRRITLPAGLSSQNIVVANVLVDGVVSRDAKLTLALDIDNVHSAFAESTLVVPESFYGKGNYIPFMKMNGDRLSNIRCWSRNVMERPLLDSILADGVIDLSVSVESTSGNRGYLAIFGDLPYDPPGQFVGPGQSVSSIERYYEGDDPRIWEEFLLQSEAAECVHTTNGETDSNDLSNCFGRQPGQYRLLLRLLFADGTLLYY